MMKQQFLEPTDSSLFVCLLTTGDARRKSTLLPVQPIFALKSHIVILRVQSSSPQSTCKCFVMKEMNSGTCSNHVSTSVSRAHKDQWSNAIESMRGETRFSVPCQHVVCALPRMALMHVTSTNPRSRSTISPSSCLFDGAQLPNPSLPDSVPEPGNIVAVSSCPCTLFRHHARHGRIHLAVADEMTVTCWARRYIAAPLSKHARALALTLYSHGMSTTLRTSLG
jgi:hypothetical protein